MVKLTDIKKTFATDKSAEADGVWKTYPGTEIKVRIRRSTHEIYRKELRKQYRRFKQLGDNMPPAVEDEIRQKAAAHALVTDWNVEDLPCTPDNVYAQFAEMPDFYKWIEGEADQFENYRVVDVAEDADPLSNTSIGSTNGETKTSSPSSNDAPDAESQSSNSSTDQN